MNKLQSLALVLLAMTALSGCETSQGNAKLEVSIPSCDIPEYRPLPPPAPTGKSDGRDLAFEYAAWGQENANRARKRSKCEARIRDRYAKGG